MTAEIYNKIRRILFSTVHNPAKGFSCAYDYLEGYRNQLGPKGYVGLKAEIDFYKRYGHEYSLTVAGDMGEHADFSGSYGSIPTRFDVTTNISVKNFSDYEPYMGQGLRYKIALLDKANFEVVDVYDLAFKRCSSCGGYLIPSIVLLEQNYNRHGESTWTNDQLLVDVCSGCIEYFEKQRFSHHGLFAPQEIFDAVGYDDDDGYSLAHTASDQHVLDSYKYFRREFDEHLMAVAQHQYCVTEPDGGGYWALQFSFKNMAIASELPDDIECSHEI